MACALAFETKPAGARTARRLHLAPGELIHAMTRLRLADDEPIALEELSIPQALIPDLTPADLEDSSFYALLEDRHGGRPARSVQTIEPALIDDEEALHLCVPAHSLALMFERTSWAADGRPVEFVRSVYRGDRYKIRTELPMPEGNGQRREHAPDAGSSARDGGTS